MFRKSVAVKRAIKVAVCMVILTTSALIARAEDKGSGENDLKIAGNYICFEEEGDRVPAKLKTGIITVRDGLIADIGKYEKNMDGVMYLDDECIIFPGLIDLHSHVEYSSFQLWTSTENEVPWDNRFEWRNSARYIHDLWEKQAVLAGRWDESFDGKNILVGDAFEYFAEAQAAAGGTTLLQGYNQNDKYDTADSHEKVNLIRSTCCAKDLGLEEGHELTCFIQLFVPDVIFDRDRPETYLPPIDTSGWMTMLQPGNTGEKDCLSELLEDIKNGTSDGYLIHIAEGRAGNLSESADDYSVLEYQTFKEAVLSGIERGDFTAKDVRDAHITLIHACTIDLDDRENYEFLRDCGIGLIWSPVSNLVMYDDTPAFYNYLDDDRLLVGIGSDWSPSGSKTVWDECKFAYSFMAKHADGAPDCAENLLKACTYKAARMIGNDNVGNIREGAFADLFILRGSGKVNGSLETALKTFIGTDDGGVEAVIRGGNPVYADIDFLKAAGSDTASYGGVGESIPELDEKYFLVPPVFEGCTFDEIYREYLKITDELEIDFSRLRSLEDPFYTEKMRSLKER